MSQNTIYICISWSSQTCCFPVKKCWHQQNSTGVSRDWYIFRIFFGHGMSAPSFIIVRYVWQILGREAFLLLPPPIRGQPQKSPSWIGLNLVQFHREDYEKEIVLKLMKKKIVLKLITSFSLNFKTYSEKILFWLSITLTILMI